MYLTVLAGETGTGKSTMAKEIVKQSPFVCVYDVQNEYDLPYYKGGQPENRFKLSPRDYDISDFVNIAKNCNGYTFVIEEATGIFKGSVGKGFIKEILSKRHSKNKFIIIFHSLHRIPPDLYEFIDFLIFFKTGDIRENIKSKFPHLIDKFDYLQTSNKTHNFNGSIISDHFTIRKSNLSQR